MNSGLREYETLTEGNITVEAWDLAGNVTNTTIALTT